MNMDETHHDLSITGHQGGPSRAARVESNQVGTSPVYMQKTAGKSLPPMYIFNSRAKYEDNFQVHLQWFEGLPSVTTQFGCPKQTESGTVYLVKLHGSTDDFLLNDYIHQVILPLYPKISKTTAFHTTTGKPLRCLVSLKLDSGPGRIVVSHDGIASKERSID